MKKLLCFVSIICLIVCLAGCGTAAPDPSPSPTSTPTPSATATPSPTIVPSPEGEVHIDSALVGQWVPVGVDTQGYILFQEDGTMVRFELQQNAAPSIQERRYELLSENTFRIVGENGVATSPFEFEIVNDGNTLNIYDTTSSARIASEFQRIE